MPLLFIIIPVIFVIIAGAMIFASVRAILIGSRLVSTGAQTTGRVLSSAVEHSGTRDNRTTKRRETIEFSGPTGAVREVPRYSDVGMLDRSGMDVAVFHDRARPELFIAPRNGRSMRIGGHLFKIGFALLFAGFAVFFLVVALGMGQFFGGITGTGGFWPGT